MKIGVHNISAEGLLPNSSEPNGVASKEPEEKQITLATAWLRRFARPLKTVRRTRGTSYNLKHQVEHWARAEKVDDPYVSNGAFIVAALRLGYVLQVENHLRCGSKNCYFNISVSSDGWRDIAA